MVEFVANKILGSNQAQNITRHGEHGLFHEGTCGEVTPSAGMDLAVGAIPAGAGIVNGTKLAAVTGSTVSISAAHASLDRRDIVWVSTAGAFGVTTGTAASSPAPPAITDARLALAEVAVGAGVTSISAGNITDKRQRLSCARYVVKTANESVTGSTSLQNDNELFFSIFPNEIWSVDLYMSIAADGGGHITVGFTGPVSFNGAAYGIATNAATLVGSGVFNVSAGSFPATASMSGSGLIIINGRIDNSSTAGTINVVWAQQTSNGAATTVSGDASAGYSYLVAHRLL